ncbi:unnamed protein product [Phyllotreta striolata]|uniref:RING-type domain-containing protein n=1 Tax=Phyllotreta striolata TaxID=444603 RepID=A0A9N9TQT2_PHYSR|nr:unnamed protein product [Phyllotreta striolata]
MKRKLNNIRIMQGSRKLPITDLNPYITCKLCDGYFVDASTIIECLHTFCRSCIIKYLQKNKYCPVCDVQVHKSKPLLNIRPDKTLQDIVYKLVPRLFQNEMQRRRKFYENHPDAKPSNLEQCGEVAYQYILAPEESICLTLNYYGANNKPRYLRCPAAVSMGHLKKLIRAKYDLSDQHRIDILYNQDCLNSSLTLIDIAYIYLWKRKGPIELSYKIYENTTKKLKLESLDGLEVNGINNNIGNDNDNNNWKEVQLRISENGEMSITGIQESMVSGLLEVVNSEPKYKNEVTTANTSTTTTSDPLSTASLNSTQRSVNSIQSSACTFTMPMISDHLTSSSNSCATLSSGCTTTVFSTINATKCSTKTDESSINVEKIEIKNDDKGFKRKAECNNTIAGPPVKQSKSGVLIHSNISLLNLSNNHPLKKYSKINRNGENVKEISTTKASLDSVTKSVETNSNSINADELKQNVSEKAETKKNCETITVTSSSTPASHSLQLKTMVSEAGLQSTCYQPKTACSIVVSNSISTPNIYSKITNAKSTPIFNTKSASDVSVSSQSAHNFKTPGSSNTQSNAIIKSVTILSKPQSITTSSQSTINTSCKLTSSSTTHLTHSNPSGSKVTITTSFSNTPPVSLQYTHESNIKATDNVAPSQNAANKTSNSTTKTKLNTPIGYKTLRDPPKSWNSQISKANLSKSSPDPKYPNLKNVRPAKFFKIRNNIPRYLGNPASGVKPMYQVHVGPDGDKQSEAAKAKKSEIKKHSIVKIDPKTLKPVSEKAPETTSLSNNNTVLQTSNLTSPMAQLYSTPGQCLNTTVTTSGGELNVQTDLKINTSSVSITNPLKLQCSSPKNERKSPKSPHSPKPKTSTSPTGNKKDNKIARNFTPPNPFVPNIPTKTSLNPNQFIYPTLPHSFPPYDPRVMAYYSQWYSQRMPFPASVLSGLSLDLNQRKNLENLISSSGPNMDALAAQLVFQMASRSLPSLPTSISPMRRCHNTPPVSAKQSSPPKKSSKEPKSDKSLETVVEKMTQNRNKTSTQTQKDVDSPKLAKTEPPKQPVVKESDENAKLEPKEAEQNETKETVVNNTVPSNNEPKTEKTEDQSEQKKETPEEVNTKSDAVTELPEKENSNTENTMQKKKEGSENGDILKSKEIKENEAVIAEETNQIETNGKE